MTRPTVTPAAERMYGRLPELYRGADEQQPDGPDGYPLLRFLSLIGDQIGALETLYDRIDFATADEGLVAGDTSDLVDPTVADDDWLHWLAQLVGIQLPYVSSGVADTWYQLTLDYPTWTALKAANATWDQVREHGATVPGAGIGPHQLRVAIADAEGGWMATSRESYEALIAPYLTGQKRVLFTPIYTGDPWRLLLESYLIETPNPAAITAALGKVPRAAGLQVSYAARTGSHWSDVAANFATWNTVKTSFATWNALAHYVP